jgi:hypothetical protein
MAKFKASARTIDMLGRQQIAGISTAISELFKNAHDAYADNVVVDYYRPNNLFILRDDGLGMTKSDFENRWLTVGTDSKIGSLKGLTLPPKDLNKVERSILGEKGIGRLAIASIGPQVLVLSRAKRDEKYDDLVAAFVNWSIFELPNIDLDQVVVPLRTFLGEKIPDKSDIEEMVDEVLQNIKELEKNNKISSEDASNLIIQVKKFNIDPQKIYNIFDYNKSEPTLLNNGIGTHFFIQPADELLQSEIEGDKNSDKASNLIKALTGFSNTMIPGAPEPNIRAIFRDHKTNDYFEELISEQQFFTPDEFIMADHHFQGEFDEYGQFKGTVTVYGEEVRLCHLSLNLFFISNNN